MTIGDAANMAIHGGFDGFDRIWGLADKLLRQLEEVEPAEMEETVLRDASQEQVVDAFFGTEPEVIQRVDVRNNYINWLKDFKVRIYDDCAVIQEIVAAIPD